MKQEAVTHDIIGAAMTVLNALKPGLDEKLYERALVLELEASGHKVRQQREFPVFYRDLLIGTLVPDLIVDESVVVETKVCTSFCDDQVAQVLGYLAITHLEVGLLLNFKKSTLEWKRIVR